MRGGTYRRTDHGLLVPHDPVGGGGAEAVAVARALREHDDELRLVPQQSRALGQYWAVYRYNGPDRPADAIATWVDFATGEALPLSHGLVERVKQLDRNNRSNVMEADELEELRERRQAKQRADDLDALIEDHARPRGRRAILPRSLGLVMARRKARAKRWNV